MILQDLLKNLVCVSPKGMKIKYLRVTCFCWLEIYLLRIHKTILGWSQMQQNPSNMLPCSITWSFFNHLC